MLDRLYRQLINLWGSGLSISLSSQTDSQTNDGQTTLLSVIAYLLAALLFGTCARLCASLLTNVNGSVALAMALGSMSAEDMTMPTSPWDDPEFKMAV